MKNVKIFRVILIGLAVVVLTITIISLSNLRISKKEKVPRKDITLEIENYLLSQKELVEKLFAQIIKTKEKDKKQVPKCSEIEEDLEYILEKFEEKLIEESREMGLSIIDIEFESLPEEAKEKLDEYIGENCWSIQGSGCMERRVYLEEKTSTIVLYLEMKFKGEIIMKSIEPSCKLITKGPQKFEANPIIKFVFSKETGELIDIKIDADTLDKEEKEEIKIPRRAQLMCEDTFKCKKAKWGELNKEKCKHCQKDKPPQNQPIMPTPTKTPIEKPKLPQNQPVVPTPPSNQPVMPTPTPTKTPIEEIKGI
jgi:hypothetical protein